MSMTSNPKPPKQPKQSSFKQPVKKVNTIKAVGKVQAGTNRTKGSVPFKKK